MSPEKARVTAGGPADGVVVAARLGARAGGAAAVDPTAAGSGVPLPSTVQAASAAAASAAASAGVSAAAGRVRTAAQPATPSGPPLSTTRLSTTRLPTTRPRPAGGSGSPV